MVKCWVPRTQRDKLLLALNDSILKAWGLGKKTIWTSWLKWKLTLARSFLGYLVCAKPYMSGNHNYSLDLTYTHFLKVNAREKTAPTERKNNQNPELDDGSTMVMRKKHKLQGMSDTFKKICMRPSGNLSKSWKRLVFHGNLGMQRWRPCACTNSAEFCFKLRKLRKTEALETWDYSLGLWHLSEGRQEMYSWGKDPTKSQILKPLLHALNGGVVGTATNLQWEKLISNQQFCNTCKSEINNC